MEQNKFNSWADTYFAENTLNQFLLLQQCIDDCKIKFGLNLSKETFRGLLLRWCDQYGYELNPHNMLDDNRKLFRNFKGLDGVQEAIYIKKTDFPKQPKTAIINRQPETTIPTTKPQWEIYIRFKESGYYTGKTNTIADAVRIATGIETLVEIETLRIEAIEPENPQEAAK